MTPALRTQGVGLGDVIALSPAAIHRVRNDGSEPTLAWHLDGRRPSRADRSAFDAERHTAFRDQIGPLASAMGARPLPQLCSSGPPGGGSSGWGRADVIGDGVHGL
jgi:hypothetical protein